MQTYSQDIWFPREGGGEGVMLHRDGHVPLWLTIAEITGQMLGLVGDRSMPLVRVIEDCIKRRIETATSM